MILIASGAYLQEDLCSEIGFMPPSFLPIGNKRIYEYQVEFLKKNASKDCVLYLSLPQSFKVSNADELKLKDLNVNVIRVPEGLSLGASILYCWNSTARRHEYLTLIHGDTLFMENNFLQDDVFSIAEDSGSYNRGIVNVSNGLLVSLETYRSSFKQKVLSGFFNFNKPLYLMKSLVEAPGDFIGALMKYQNEVSVNLQEEDSWLDFGHLNSFFHSRTKMTTQRVFNSLVIKDKKVNKSSVDKPKKVFAEGSWFEQLPLPLRFYSPALLDLVKGGKNHKDASYQIEYLYLLPLSDLYVFGYVDVERWNSVFQSLESMLKTFSNYNIGNLSIQNNDTIYLNKTLERLKEFDFQYSFGVSSKKVKWFAGAKSYTLVEMAHIAAEFIKKTSKDDLAIMHGDLCFSNILYDSRSGVVKCIDPRGLTPSGDISIYGDKRYDYAKLYHSIVGFYDFIIADRYEYSLNDDGYSIQFSGEYDEVYRSFITTVLDVSGYSEKEILAINVHLFLSMLPLHYDNPSRQQAFIANALRLFNKLIQDDFL